MENQDKLIIIDGNSLLYRAFYAIPEELSTKEGIPTNGIYGFLNFYYKIIEEYRPDYLTVVFDKKGATFRHKEFEDYKAGRKKTPDNLGIQIPILKEILETMGIKTFSIERYEADDIAGTISKESEKLGLKTLLVSGDKDYLQLVDENTEVIVTIKGISKTKIYDLDEIDKEFELTPRQLIDLKGLMGDKSDNIPGVPGVGIKTGKKLLKDYSTLENIYENISTMKESKLKENLQIYKNQALMSKRIGTIERNVPIEINIDELKVKKSNEKKVLDKFKEYELKSLYKKVITEESKITEEKEKVKIVSEFKNIININELENILKNVQDSISIKFLFEEDYEIAGLGLGIKGKYYYIDFVRDLINRGFCKQSVLKKLKPILENERINKIGYDIKEDLLEFKKENIDTKAFSFDSSLALYLLNPSLGDYSIENIAKKILETDIEKREDILGKGKKKKRFSDLTSEKRGAIITIKLNVVDLTLEKLKEKLINSGMKELFEKIEIPLSEVLADMEYLGFKVDEEELNIIDKYLTEKQNRLIKRIQEQAEENFNVNSPKQLGEILFQKLNLPVIKKTKTGFSTNIEVLEKLKDEHPIIPLIIEYRHISKLKSTYIDGIRKVININTGRVHSKFKQTITTTGRISSTEPNLQNIPIRTDEGREIRKLFVAENENYKLVDADYSQIELRVLADISNDKKLIDAFDKEEDIHTRTASEVFGVPQNEVTSEMRSRAKAVNFGIIYGISSFGLSRDLNISVNQAKKYIYKYLEKYPHIKAYMSNIVKEGKEKGYVETIFKRRRYIPELNSSNYNLKSFGERIALNTPIQGSAADIIKIAMIKVYKELKNRKLKSKLILQVHDELIIETHVDELKEVKKILKDTMESAVDLKVPLKIEMKDGNSWYDTK